MEYTFSTREKNGSVCLILSYKVGHKWRQKTKQGFKNQREARKYQDTLLKQVKESIGVNAPDDMRKVTLRQFMFIFERDKKNALAYNTIASYRGGVFRLRGLLDKPLIEINVPDILNAVNALSVSDSTKTITVRSLSVVLEYARIAYHIIAKNPARGIKVIRKKAQEQLRAFTKDEVAKLLSLLAQRPTGYLVAFIAANTGMRFGEIAGLMWEDVDFFHRTISVKQQWGLKSKGQYALVPLKTANSKRVIPISPQLVDKLLERKTFRPAEITGTIFPLKKMGSIHTSINAVIRRHFPGRSFHSLRHTYATLLLSKTGDINLVAHILGDTVATVSKTYVNYTADISKVAAEAVASLY